MSQVPFFKVSVKDFYSFFSYELEIDEPFKIMVVKGPNGIGKSLLLEAIASIDDYNDDTIYERRKRYPSGLVSVKVGEIYEEADVKPMRGVTAEKHFARIIYPVQTVDPEPLFDDVLKYAVARTISLVPDIHYIYVKQAEESEGDEFVVVTKDFTEYPLSMAGRGFINAFNIILNYSKYPTKLVLIDDIDALAMGPELLKGVLELLTAFRSIVIATATNDWVFNVATEVDMDAVLVNIISRHKYETMRKE